MPMTQTDIRSYYADHWRTVDGQRGDGADAEPLRYSSPVQDAVLYPVYERLIRDLGLRVDGGSILDVGCGAGRWLRFFLDRFAPARLTGVDFAASSIEMLRAWSNESGRSDLALEVGDLTDPSLPAAPAFSRPFDLVNVGNVLFHIPEDDEYRAAIRNLATLVAPDGAIVTTEFLPRTTMRTEWMLVRSRYEFEAICDAAGLEIAEVRAATFFSAEPMGLDGPDDGARRHFQRVRGLSQQLLASAGGASRSFLVDYLAEIDRACLAFARERVADIELPAQKLVVLRRRTDRAPTRSPGDRQAAGSPSPTAARS